VGIAPDATAHHTPSPYDSSTGYTTSVTAIGPDGTTITTGPLPGDPVGAVQIAPDGTAYQAVRVAGSTRIVLVGGPDAPSTEPLDV